MNISTSKHSGRVEIQTAKALRTLLKNYYAQLADAVSTKKRPVAWLSSVGPVELVRAMGFETYFPENHGALLGATRQAARFIPHAVSEGYSPDICAYLTADIGAYRAKSSPLTEAYGIPGPPRPDVLVYSTNQCRDVGDWFSYYGREYKVPVIGVHPPHLLDEVLPEHLQTVEAEHRRVVSELEALTGKRLDHEYLREIVAQSRRASLLWREILDFAKHHPSPLTFFDSAIHMAPIVLMRGTPEAIQYYELLKAELSERIQSGVAAVPGETLRLYWEGMPIWGALRDLSTTFFERQSAVVASTYCNTWAFDKIDPDNIEQSMALVYTELFINRSDRVKLDILQRLVKDFRVDGMIFHDCKTCPNNTNCRYGLAERLSEELGIPTVTIGGDMADLRLYSPDQAKTVLEGFIEQLSECHT